MFYIYAMKSLQNGLWYIGLTAYPERRRKQHLRLRPDLYGKGHLFKIIARRKTVAAIGALEQRLIQKYNTLWPNGNNLSPGGLTGTMRAFVEAYGTEAMPARLASGSLFSRKAITEAAAKVRAKHGKKAAYAFLTKQIIPQVTRDRMAIARLAKFADRESELSKSAIYARHRKAWLRHHAGLPPLRGTEHYLLRPEKYEWYSTVEQREKQRASRLKWIAKQKAAGLYPTPRVGRGKGKKFTQESKDKIALRRMHHFKRSGKKISYQGAWNRRKRFWQRHDKGLPPLPGTEHFLKEPRRPPTQPPSQKTHQKRSATMKAKYARYRAEGHEMPRPPSGSRGAFSQASKAKLAASNVQKSLTAGLHYDYKNILKCSAKAKKRHAEGRSPIPGTECFVRLQTAPTKGPKYTIEQRDEYRRVMIERVNAWLRRYAIDRGWRTH